MSDERVQHRGHRVPGPAALRLRPRRDAGRHRGDVRHDRAAGRPATIRCCRPTSTARSCRRPARRTLRRCPATATTGSASTASTSTSAPRPTRPSRWPAARRRAAFTLALPDDARLRAAAGTATGSTRIGDRPMFRAAYRNFADGHEALVGNVTVCVVNGGVAGRVRWCEISNVTSGTPALRPAEHLPARHDLALDGQRGDGPAGQPGPRLQRLSSRRHAAASAMPGGSRPIRPTPWPRAKRPLFAGTGSQSGTSNRWGDYSDLTVDPVDDCTFWYTQEYYATTSSFNWRTRIGNFRFPNCAMRTLSVSRAGPARYGMRIRPASAAARRARSSGGAARPSPSTAAAAHGSAFAGWSGACSGKGACSVNLGSDKSVPATFSRCRGVRSSSARS